MKHQYSVKPTVPYETTLEFSWDSDSGEVTGRDAGRVLEMAGWDEIFIQNIEDDTLGHAVNQAMLEVNFTNLHPLDILLHQLIC